MGFIINFFEYTLSGWLYVIWLLLMLIFSLACLGVVGDKVFKQKEKERLKLREVMAEEEYKKAQELIEKQSMSAGIDNSDPLAPKYVKNNDAVKEVDNPNTNQPADTNEQQNVGQVLDLDSPVKPADDKQVVDNITPIVDNTSEDAVKTDVPAVLVINDDGTSNT